MIKRTYLKFKAIIITVKKGICFFWREHHFLVPFSLWKKYLKRFFNRVKKRSGELYYDPFNVLEYQKWLNSQVEEENKLEFSYTPLISILIPVYNVEPKILEECLLSVLQQSYQNFEVCLVDDCSTNAKTIEILKDYQQKSSKIKVCFRNSNGHISKASNTALQMATGEYIALLDNDDVLSSNALYENVKVLNQDPTIDFIYSDEDKLNSNGQYCEPHFKPDFSPDTLLGVNYICHFAVIKTAVVRQVGGFSVGLEGAQDHDLFLKVTELTNRVYHIPKILYHWRMTEGSTAASIEHKEYATNTARLAIEAALKRRKISAKVHYNAKTSYHIIEYTYKQEPSVSIIIPTRDHCEITHHCLESIYKKTEYHNYEIIVVDNNSIEDATFKMFQSFKHAHQNFRVIKADMDFNYSKINNLAIQKSNSDIIILLNNDTEIISKDWLHVLVGYAMQPHIGAVGPKLLYEDGTIQHGGVILGLGDIAAHAFLREEGDAIGVYGRLQIPYNYSAVTGACLAIEKKKILEIGMLNENLKVAYNDVELNIKLLKAGYYNVFVPQISIYHLESKSRGLDSTKEKYRLYLKERQYMLDNYKEYIKADKFYNCNFSKRDYDANFLLDKIIDN